MGKASEFALHPHELFRILDRFFFCLRHMAADEIAAMFRSSGKASSYGGFIIKLPDLFTLVDRRVENDVGIAMFRRPDNGFAAHHAGNPYAGVVAASAAPVIDHTQLIMVAFPRNGPGWVRF